MIPRGSAFGCSLLRILWAPVHISFALYILVWTWDEWNLPALPYHPFLSIFTILPPSLITILATVYLMCAVCIGIGLHTRFFQTFLALLTIPLFFHSASTYHNHYAFALFIAVFLAMLPTERFFSFDAKKKKRTLSPSAFQTWQHQEHLLTGQFLILLQTSFLYAFAALNKMNPIWFGRWISTPEFVQLSGQSLFGPLISFFFDHHLLWVPLAGVTAIMLFLSIGIFFTRRYPWIACIGILLHILLELSLPVIIFTPMIMSIWLVALFPAEHPFTKSIEKQFSLPRRGRVRERG